MKKIVFTGVLSCLILLGLYFIPQAGKEELRMEPAPIVLHNSWAQIYVQDRKNLTNNWVIMYTGDETLVLSYSGVSLSKIVNDRRLIEIHGSVASWSVLLSWKIGDRNEGIYPIIMLENTGWIFRWVIQEQLAKENLDTNSISQLWITILFQKNKGSSEKYEFSQIRFHDLAFSRFKSLYSKTTKIFDTGETTSKNLFAYWFTDLLQYVVFSSMFFLFCLFLFLPKSHIESSFQLFFWILAAFFVLVSSLYAFTKWLTWHDEAYSWVMVQEWWKEMLQSIKQDVHPPLYYFYLKLVTFFLWINPILLKVTSTILLIPIFLMGRLFILYFFWKDKQREALLFVFLFGMHFYSIMFSGFIRMYLLGMIAYMIATYFFLKIISNPHTRNMWNTLGYIVFCILWLYIHNYVLFFLVAHWIVVAFLILKEKSAALLKLSLLLGGIIFLAYLPWVWVILEKVQYVNEDYWIAPLTSSIVFEFLAKMVVYVPNVDGINPIVMMGMVGIIYIYIVYSAYWKFRETNNLKLFYVILAISTVPLLLSILYSINIRSIFVDRYFLFWFPFLFFLLVFQRKPFLLILALFGTYFFSYNLVSTEYIKHLQPFQKNLEILLDDYSPNQIIHMNWISLFLSEISAYSHHGSFQNLIYMDNPQNLDQKKFIYTWGGLMDQFRQVHKMDLANLWPKIAIVFTYNAYGLNNKEEELIHIPDTWVKEREYFPEFSGLRIVLYKNLIFE